VLTGGTLGMVWPSAQMQPASNAGPGTLLGAYGGFAGGNPATGTLFEALLLGSIPSAAASGSSGVSSIHSTTGAFTFTGSGVSCASTTCTFTGGGSGIANIQLTMPTFSIAANTCTSAATATMTGLITTSTFDTGWSADVSGVTGW